jgi:flavin reductase (DIM6/NTAB) family NADH-FMN oxidoreductase RutF
MSPTGYAGARPAGTTPDDPAAGPPLTRDHLRRLLRRQAATVAVITAAGQDRPVGFTATTFTPVSIRPPLISFCLHRESSTWPTFEAAEYVAVHLLHADQADVARTFAARGVDRFAGTAWHLGAHSLPMLDGALAWLACHVTDRIPAGDHTLVLAEPLAADYAEGSPLIYHDGDYHRPPGPVPPARQR